MLPPTVLTSGHRHQRAKIPLRQLAIALSACLTLTGCLEWDNSDKYKDDNQTNSGTPDNNGGGDYQPGGPTDPDNGQNPDSGKPTFSGSFGTESGGPLVNAEVCYDANKNQNCDDGESTTNTSENGEYTLPVSDGTTQGSVIVKTKKGETTHGDSGNLTDPGFAHTFEQDTDTRKDTVIPSPTDANLTLVDGIITTPDGPLGNAEVCADLNANGECDPDEPKTTTDEDGEYEITLPGDTNLSDTDIIITTKPGETTIGNDGETVITEEVFPGNVDVGTEDNQNTVVPAPDYTFKPKPDNGGQIKGHAIGYFGYLFGAKVCLDINFDDKCGSGEPTQITGSKGTFQFSEPSGDFQLIAIATAGDTTNEGAATTISNGYTIASPYDPYTLNQIISPITDRVATKLEEMPTPKLDAAKVFVAESFSTSNDPSSDFLEDQNSNDSLKAENAERLERIVATLGKLRNKIDDTITDIDRTESGLTDDEIDDQINDQIDSVLPDINDDVDDSLEPDSPFDPDEIVSDPKYDDVIQKPDLSPTTPDITELERRIAAAPKGSDLFYQNGYERLANPNGQTNKLRFYPDARERGKFYYEAISRQTTSTDKDQADVKAYLLVPKYQPNGLGHKLVPFSREQGSQWCNPFALYPGKCSLIQHNPATFTTQSWSGRVWRQQKLRRGMNPEMTMTESNNPGEIIMATKGSGLTIKEELREISLDGLDIMDTIKTFWGDELPGIDFATLSAGRFNGNAAAYSLKSEVSGDIISSYWPVPSIPNSWPTAPSTEAFCHTPGQPQLSVVSSCNLIYGYASANMPAKSLNEVLYPNASLGQTYPDNTASIPISGPGQKVYAMRLYGKMANVKGSIQIDQKQPDGSWKPISTSGEWKSKAQSSALPHITIHLPDQYTMRPLASGAFHAGSGVLYERKGYVRHGWITPRNVDPAQLFNKKPHKMLINGPAFQQIHESLRMLDLLFDHPYFLTL